MATDAEIGAAASATGPVATTAPVATDTVFAVANSRRAAAASTHDTGANAGAPEPPPKSTDNADGTDDVPADEDTADTGAATATARTTEIAATGAADGVVAAVADSAFDAVTAGEALAVSVVVSRAAGFEAATGVRFVVLPMERSADDAACFLCLATAPPVGCVLSVADDAASVPASPRCSRAECAWPFAAALRPACDGVRPAELPPSGDELDEEPDVSAQAVPVPSVTVAPTPKATANVPTRPTNRPAPICVTSTIDNRVTETAEQENRMFFPATS